MRIQKILINEQELFEALSDWLSHENALPNGSKVIGFQISNADNIFIDISPQEAPPKPAT